METPIIFKMNRDFALSRCLAFRQFCEVRVVRLEMIGQGGGREFVVDKIGEGVGKIGHGGGRERIVK